MLQRTLPAGFIAIAPCLPSPRRATADPPPTAARPLQAGLAAAAPPSSVMNSRRFITAIRGTGRYGMFSSVVASLRLDIGSPDHLAPLLGVVGDELTELGRRARKHRAAEVGKACFQPGIGEARIDLDVEPSFGELPAAVLEDGARPVQGLLERLAL